MKKIVNIQFIKDLNDGTKKGSITKTNLKDAILWERAGIIKILDKINQEKEVINKNVVPEEKPEKIQEKGVSPKVALDIVNKFLEKSELQKAKDFINNCEFRKIEDNKDAELIAEFWKLRDLVEARWIKEGKKGFKEDKPSPKERIEIPGNGILISEFADTISPVFKNKNLLFYREDIESIVEIKNNEFKEVKPIRFITLIEKYFIPWSKVWKKNGSVFDIEKSISHITSSAVLASPNFENGILKIERIFPVQLPIMYEGKLTFPIKGYDARFKSWTLSTAPEINPDMKLQEAKEILYKIYNEFCFQTKQDYINAIAGLLTPFLRGLFSNFNIRTPLKGYLANRERAGKDFCAGITGIVYEGKYVEETPISTGEFKSSGTNDELRKKIMSAFIQGRMGLHFANNKGKLNNAVLEGVLTNPTYSDRILGTNKMGVFSNEMDFSFSGNIGITLTPDLINRTIFTRLFLDIEDANTRKFKNPELHNWISKNRDKILSALYSLIKNWVERKKPNGSLPFASYPEWANICGGIMEAADIGNPCVKDEISNQGISLDPESEEMKILFETMFEKYPEEWIDKQRIRSTIIGSDGTLMPFIDWEKKSDQVKFGQKLNKNVDRLFSDIRLIVENKKIRTTRWKYKFTKEISTFDKKEIFGLQKVQVN